MNEEKLNAWTHAVGIAFAVVGIASVLWRWNNGLEFSVLAELPSAGLLFLLLPGYTCLAWLSVPLYVLIALPARQNYALALQDMLHGGTVLIDHPEGAGTRITMTLAIRQAPPGNLRSPRLRIDYAGERDHGLVELADVLPASLYEKL